jgi:hypothetical protein
LDEVKMQTSASQFVLWMEYLEWEVNAFDRTCYYLAQIAAEIRRPNVKRGVVVNIKDFLLKFVHERQQKPAISARERVKVDRQKHFFFGLTGLLGKGKKKRKGKK